MSLDTYLEQVKPYLHTKPALANVYSSFFITATTQKKRRCTSSDEGTDWSAFDQWNVARDTKNYQGAKPPGRPLRVYYITKWKKPV